MLLESPDKSRESDKTGADPEPATILLVEDEERVREVIELTLRLSGFNVISTGSSMEALDIIENYDGAIHLMVTDFAMPHMNGADLAAKLKRARPLVQVLYISGFPKQDVQDFHRMSGSAILEFLQKPFTPEVLESKIREMLAHAA